MTYDPRKSGRFRVPTPEDFERYGERQPGPWRMWAIVALSVAILVIVLAVGTFGARGCS